ncbi:MAG: copper resistance protein NlpE [Prevotellaceae bacterium]|jgi:uncharacterized lipoprotein NlpE involved in copper resistance|nr:copper resistance protein NlpE [Prevotellaceae bacterium]
MKRVFFAVMIAALTLGMYSCKPQSKSEQYIDSDIIHNSRNSINWQGTYTGTLPCADCTGIQTAITLSDSTYVLETVYLGKSKKVFRESAKFFWDADGSKITLANADNAAPINRQYIVGEGTLTQLDNEGNSVEGEHAEMYILHKNS